MLPDLPDKTKFILMLKVVLSFKIWHIYFNIPAWLGYIGLTESQKMDRTFILNNQKTSFIQGIESFQSAL